MKTRHANPFAFESFIQVHPVDPMTILRKLSPTLAKIMQAQSENTDQDKETVVGESILARRQNPYEDKTSFQQRKKRFEEFNNKLRGGNPRARRQLTSQRRGRTSK